MPLGHSSEAPRVVALRIRQNRAALFHIFFSFFFVRWPFRRHVWRLRKRSLCAAVAPLKAGSFAAGSVVSATVAWRSGSACAHTTHYTLFTTVLYEERALGEWE